ncbi:ABC transporter permease [Bacillus licheniformis]|uniref:ABC transporter permease n=1 Tax=Bacillus licheniformis TaxID=1402 RepID=UPI0011AA54DC|nr:ABC transporter permease subunit [Bacillus licheniformis]TWM50723.1 hypothetical protein CHCC14815_2669 [Bacillus licheniformis]
MRVLKNELYRLMVTKSTWIVLSLLLVMTIAVAWMVSNGEKEKETSNWKEQLTVQNAQYEREMRELSPAVPKYQFLKEEIAVNQYRLEHNLPPSAKYNVWTMLKELKPITTLIALIAIVLAANSIALEHSKGTIKFAIATPVKRWHYLLGKYLSILLNTVFMFAATLLFAFVLGYALLGLEGSQYYLSYRSGEVIKMSMLKFLALDYGAALLNIIVLATLAFMISVILRSAVVSVGLSLFVFFTGSAITQFLAAKFDWTKYTIFANSDLSQYIDGEPFIQDMTLSFSAAVIAVYFILFLAVSFWVFQKRDIVTS